MTYLIKQIIPLNFVLGSFWVQGSCKKLAILNAMYRDMGIKLYISTLMQLNEYNGSNPVNPNSIILCYVRVRFMGRIKIAQLIWNLFLLHTAIDIHIYFNTKFD